MGFFDFLKQPDVNRGVREFESMKEAVLLDVRAPQEYREGHIPGSKNLPLHTIDNADEVIDNIDVPVFVYCHSGARSARAAVALIQMGYTNVKNIGGIAAYTGEVER